MEKNQIGLLQSSPGINLKRYSKAKYKAVTTFSDISCTSMLQGYPILNIFDNDSDTAWVHEKKQSGIGEWINISFDNVTDVSGIILVNGYQKSNDTLKKNNSIKELQIKAGDDNLNFDLEKPSYCIQYEKIFFNEPIKTNYIKLIIKDIYEGSKYSDTCISELIILKSCH